MFLLSTNFYFHDNALYLFTYLYLFILFASRICYPRRHNVTALSVSMVFCDEDKIPIENLYLWKGYNVRQLRTEFQTKDGQLALT